MTQLRRQALRLVTEDPELDRRFRPMPTTTGIGETSALQILGELAVLPDTLDARQWVAFSGLDPRLFKSGKSVEKRPRISRGAGTENLRWQWYNKRGALQHDEMQPRPHPLRSIWPVLIARARSRRARAINNKEC
jgi:transposase